MYCIISASHLWSPQDTHRLGLPFHIQQNVTPSCDAEAARPPRHFIIVRSSCRDFLLCKRHQLLAIVTVVSSVPYPISTTDAYPPKTSCYVHVPFFFLTSHRSMFFPNLSVSNILPSAMRLPSLINPSATKPSDRVQQTLWIHWRSYA